MHIDDLKNNDIYIYYKYLCTMSNKFNNPSTSMSAIVKKPKHFGNLILLYKIQQIAVIKSLQPKDFCKIINKNPNYFYYGIKNHGLNCNTIELKQLIKKLIAL